MRLLICGDRKWKNKKRIFRLLKSNKQRIDVVIEGDATGADKLAGECCMKLGIPYFAMPAHWDFYKKAAGPIRNSWMLKFGKPDEVWAFHSDIKNSKGTADMVKRAKREGIVVRIFEK